MNRRDFLKTTGLIGTASIIAPISTFSNPIKSDLEEYSFIISPTKCIGIREVDTTPQQFVLNEANVEAAINGPYFDKNGKTEGLAYMANNHQFASLKPEHIKGYFSLNRKGDKVQVTESLQGTLDDYFLVIGTHPMLLENNKVHPQALQVNYDSNRLAYRSAIGTKSGKDICFAVSSDQILMSEWAQRLENAGYYGAINLDGGPISQMAVTDKNNQVSTYGKGTGNTRLVIFSYNR